MIGILTLRDIEKTYSMGEVEVKALRGVSLQIQEGDFLAIMGPSGSGKSTLMNIVGCLDRPTGGSYLFLGLEVSSLSDRELAGIRREKIGFIFQTFNLLPQYTALSNVEVPMIYAGVPAKERRRRAEEALEMVGIGERAHHRPKELSGGQNQRVAIARALINNPSFLLADEPTGNLDSKTGQEIMDLFLELNQRGICILLVTHDPLIAEHAKKSILVRDGSIVEECKG